MGRFVMDFCPFGESVPTFGKSVPMTWYHLVATNSRVQVPGGDSSRDFSYKFPTQSVCGKKFRQGQSLAEPRR